MVRFQNKIQSGGVMFLNSSLIEDQPDRGDIEVVNVPANAVAERIGNIRSANMVLLGAFIKRSNIVSLDSLIEGLAVALKGKPKIISINKEALTVGYELI
jgi:2-oxoglutarate ferredoxin oxidoreductase subunit gamma